MLVGLSGPYKKKIGLGEKGSGVKVTASSATARVEVERLTRVGFAGAVPAETCCAQKTIYNAAQTCSRHRLRSRGNTFILITRSACSEENRFSSWKLRKAPLVLTPDGLEHARTRNLPL